MREGKETEREKKQRVCDIQTVKNKKIEKNYEGSDRGTSTERYKRQEREILQTVT
jgi:hypothetical protein